MDNIKRHSWLSICYLLILILTIPFQVVNLSNKDYITKNDFYNLFHLTQYQMQLFVIMVFPVLTAVLLFRYIHVKGAADMMHSLPIKRVTLFVNQVGVGILIMLLPIIITGIVCGILRNSMNLSHFFTNRDVIDWALYTFLYDMIFYSACIFFGVIVGMSVLQSVFTYIFLFLPVGLIILGNYVFQVILFGYNASIGTATSALSPIGMLIDHYNDRINSTPVTAYTLLCIFFILGSLWLYNRRKIEAATEAIAFKNLNYIFKYSTTFCTMLVCGVYLSSTQNRSFTWLLFGFLIGSFIGYFTSEMLIKKSLWIFNNFKGYALYLLIIVLLLTGLKFDIIGYQNRIPELNNISYISMDYYGQYSTQNIEKYSFKTQTSFTLIRKLHKQIIKDKNRSSKNTSTEYFTYKLKNGKTLSRSYSINRKDYIAFLKPLSESEEYKRIYNQAYTLSPTDVDKITISPNNKSTYVTIVAPEEIKQLISILKQEIHNKNYEEENSSIQPWATIDFLIKDKSIEKYIAPNPNNGYNYDNTFITANFDKSYTQLEKWLKQKGYLNNTRVLPEDINSFEIKKINNFYQHIVNTNINTEFDTYQAPIQTITNPSQLEVCLRNYEGLYTNRTSNYLIRIKYKNGFTDYGTFNDTTLPAFVNK